MGKFGNQLKVKEIDNSCKLLLNCNISKQLNLKRNKYIFSFYYLD